MRHTGNKSVFGNMTRMVILLAVCATANLAAQEVTHLSSWTKYVDPMASKSAGDAIVASAPVVNLPGARVRVIATCSPVENPGSDARPRYIVYRISISGATLDSLDRSISHESGTWLAPIITYSSERVISIKMKYGSNEPYAGQTNPIDPHSFSIPSYFPNGVPTKTITMNDALFEFPANGTEIILAVSGTQPSFANFASRCYVPTADELDAIKRSAEKKAADEAAEAASREQAAEQARIAQAQTEVAKSVLEDIQAAIDAAALKRFKAAEAPVEAYLSLGPIPASCARPELGSSGKIIISVARDTEWFYPGTPANNNGKLNLKKGKPKTEANSIFLIDLQTAIPQGSADQKLVRYSELVMRNGDVQPFNGYLPVANIAYCK